MTKRAHVHVVLLLSLLVSGSMFLLTQQHSYAFAADNTITITAQSSTLNYPKSIDFKMSAHDNSGQIQEATLYIQYNQNESYSEQDQLTVPAPGSNETLTWHEDTSSVHYNPVGTQINYYWIVSDNANHTQTSTPQSLHITDNRFQWQQSAQGMFRIHWYRQGSGFGQMVTMQVVTSIQRIQQTLGQQLKQTIDVWIYASSNDFRGSLSPSTHEWVGGIAFPRLNQCEIVVTGPDDDTLRRDMPHELTHLIFHQQDRIEIPLWFDEGLAVYNQRYHDPNMVNSYDQALTNHSLLHLQDITSSFPTDANMAYLAYAQSWKLLDYMYTTFGQQKMAALITSTGRDNTTFNEDLQQTIGLDIPHLENQWRSANNQPLLAISNNATSTTPITIPVITLNDPLQPFLYTASIALILLPLLGCLGFLTTQYQRRKRWSTQNSQPDQYIYYDRNTFSS